MRRRWRRSRAEKTTAPGDDRADDEERLDPEVRRRSGSGRSRAGGRARRGASVTAPPIARSSTTEPGDRRAVAGMAARRLVDPRGVAADAGRQHLADGVRDEVGARQPRDRLADAARAQEHLPAPRLRRDRDQGEHRREREPGRLAPRDRVDRLPEVDLRDEVRHGEARDERPSRRRGTSAFFSKASRLRPGLRHLPSRSVCARPQPRPWQAPPRASRRPRARHRRGRTPGAAEPKT